MKKLLIALLILIPLTVFASDTLFESYTSDDDWVNPAGISWNAQPFVASSNHSVTSIKLKGFKNAGGGTLTIDIDADDGTGKPNISSVLGSRTFDCTTLGTGTGGTVFEVTGYSGVNLTSGTTYHIVLHGPGNSCSIRAKGTSGSTPVFLYSGDSGSTWVTGTPDKGYFEVYGIGAATGFILFDFI